MREFSGGIREEEEVRGYYRERKLEREKIGERGDWGEGREMLNIVREDR